MRCTADGVVALALIALSIVLEALPAAAHGVGHGPPPPPLFSDYLILGTAHMISGYDHLLFVAGMVILVSTFKDVVKSATIFTVGHSLTLLVASLARWTVNAQLIDSLIAISVAYIGTEILWATNC